MRRRVCDWRIGVKRLARLLMAGAVFMAIKTAKAEAASEVTSPDGKLSVVFSLTADGMPRYAVTLGGKAVVGESKMGVVREDVDFSRGLTLIGEEAVEKVADTYDL